MTKRRFPVLFTWLMVVSMSGLLGMPRAAAQYADSLARLLRTLPADTNRVIVLVDYAWEINETETVRADSLLREAIQLAKKLQYRSGEASAYNGLGVVEEIRGNFDRARLHYRKALDLRRQLGDKAAIGASLNNLGVLYEMIGRFDSALVYHQENLEIQEALGDTVRIARAQFNIAGAYQEMGVYVEAQGHLNDARLILEAQNDLDGMAKVYAQLGHIQFELDRYGEALENYARELEYREKLNEPARLAEALTDYANALDELDSSELAVTYYLRALTLWQELDDQPGIANVYINISDAHKHIGNYELALDYLRQAEAICLSLDDTQGLMEVYNTMGDVYYRDGKQERSLEMVRKYYRIAQEIKDNKYIQGAYKDFAEVYAAMGEYKQAYEYRVKYDEFRYKNLNEKISAEYARKEALFEDRRRIEKVKQQQKDLELQDAKLAESRTRQYALLGGGLALLVLVALLLNRNRMRARANRELAEKNRAIEHERKRADDLLTNILPEATAAELKAHASVRPVRYESVTVMFTDFKGFTKIAEDVSFEVLIGELDECFSLFDRIVEEYGLEKIKTIGDSYMCAGGLPLVNTTHPQDVVRAAIAMQRGLQLLMEQKKREGKPVFEMRIGIHTGPVVAGVVGSHKFAYDIWGDTVNTAARLEQGSESYKINISETTYQAVKDQFHCTYRGKLAAKNKGEIAMYFVEYNQEEGSRTVITRQKAG
ncbi:MAG: tetratricopeptide repeat protein [Bacteroidetes bacterium]|nr:MAG: tetratricopeptide repeat protein [Bacteroidota bacterium]